MFQYCRNAPPRFPTWYRKHSIRALVTVPVPWRACGRWPCCYICAAARCVVDSSTLQPCNCRLSARSVRDDCSLTATKRRLPQSDNFLTATPPHHQNAHSPPAPHRPPLPLPNIRHRRPLTAAPHHRPCHLPNALQHAFPPPTHRPAILHPRFGRNPRLFHNELRDPGSPLSGREQQFPRFWDRGAEEL